MPNTEDSRQPTRWRTHARQSRSGVRPHRPSAFIRDRILSPSRPFRPGNAHAHTALRVPGPAGQHTAIPAVFARNDREIGAYRGRAARSDARRHARRQPTVAASQKRTPAADLGAAALTSLSSRTTPRALQLTAGKTIEWGWHRGGADVSFVIARPDVSTVAKCAAHALTTDAQNAESHQAESAFVAAAS
jgi:hypothetical protein